MRSTLKYLASALIALSTAISVQAQTPTPWLPEATPAPNSDILPRGPLYVSLLSNSTTTNASAGVYVAGYSSKQVQFTIGACSTHTTVVEGSQDGLNWTSTPLQSVSNSDVGANSTLLSSVFTQPIRYLRTRVSANSGCTVSTSLAANP